MEPNDSLISRAGARADSVAGAGVAKADGVLEKFQKLPTMGKVLLGVGVLALLYVMFGGGNSTRAPQGSTNMGQVGGTAVSPTTAFGGLETDRPALMQNVFEQNRRDMAELRGRMEEQFTQRDIALQQALEQNQELQKQMQQMMTDFTAEIKNMQESREQDAARLSQLADQQRQIEMGAPVGDASMMGPMPSRRQPIRQTSLGPPPLGFSGGPGLLAPITSGLSNATGALAAGGAGGAPVMPVEPKPFIPPLGFVEATLLNGVDALAGGGQGTPALARISGNYTTAMNNTVMLDGCIVMMEFVGNLSTERATGKPMRMTCVYPDNGAATYELTGYVVDAEDGVIGVPGLLYEGDPTRIAGSMMADFLAGVGELIEQNQTTNTTNADGVTTNVLTGDQTKAEIASGVNKMFTSISEYLRERVDRQTPFIRLDALRRVNLVILSGQELRTNGKPWTVLFDANGADKLVPPTGGPQTVNPQPVTQTR